MSSARSTRFSSMRRGDVPEEIEVVEKTTTTETVKECDAPMVGDMRHHHMGGHYGWGHGLAMVVLWFIVLTIFIWLIIYSLRPAWVLKSGIEEVNLAMVLGVSLLIALILMIIIGLIWWAVSRN